MMPPLTADEACRQLNVSRETQDRLEAYAAILTRWQNSINLVSRSTLADLWRRHILDCGQVFRHLSDPSAGIMDIGSGAGLPGLVLAILGADNDPAASVTLVESDERKCAFLAVAARAADVRVTIVTNRIEQIEANHPGAITARALAPLDRLLDWTASQHHPGLECLFMKGASHAEEMACLEAWPDLQAEIIPSQSSPEGVIIRLTGFATPALSPEA